MSLFPSHSKGWIVESERQKDRGPPAQHARSSDRIRRLVYDTRQLNRLLTNRDKCSIIRFIKGASPASSKHYYTADRRRWIWLSVHAGLTQPEESVFERSVLIVLIDYEALSWNIESDPTYTGFERSKIQVAGDR